MMNTHDTLLAFSEWLEGEEVVVAKKGDERTHEDLVNEFIAYWNADPLREPLAGPLGIGGTKVEGATEIGEDR